MAFLGVYDTKKHLSWYAVRDREKVLLWIRNPANGFTVRIGNRLYAHKGRLDNWLLNQILSQ